MSHAAQQANPEEAHGGFVAATWKALVLFAALAVLTLCLLAVAYFGNGPIRSVGFTSSPAPLQIVIGNDVFFVPENMIRLKNQRTEGVAHSVDLAIHWPSARGYSGELLAAFSSTDPTKVKTVLIGISQRQSLLDMQSRFGPALQRALVPGSETEFENGLIEARFDPQYGFMDETLVYSKSTVPGGDPQFVARCHKAGTHETLLHPCELDLFVGVSGVARKTYLRHQLNDWRGFQNWLDVVLGRLIAGDA
ncbi:MAG: hypothetical protein AAFY99_02125 [Pseudomonadota bacterium]